MLHLYRSHYQDVYRFLLYFAGDRNDVEDLTQEVFLRVYKSFARFEGRSEPKTWILAIAKHVAMDHFRRKKMYRLLVEQWVQLFTSSHADSPESDYEKREDWELGRHGAGCDSAGGRADVVIRPRAVALRFSFQYAACLAG